MRAIISVSDKAGVTDFLLKPITGNHATVQEGCNAVTRPVVPFISGVVRSPASGRRSTPIHALQNTKKCFTSLVDN